MISNKETDLLTHKGHRYFLITTGLIAGVSFFDFLASWHLIELIGISLSKNGSGMLAQWQVAGIFISGYLSRPIGAYLVGRYGDKYGRKPALSLNFFMLITFTLIIAILPTYESLRFFGLEHLGIIFFMLAKFGQGLAFGSQFPILWVYATEKLPLQNIGLGTGIITAAAMMGGFIFFILFSLIENNLTLPQISEYGWRLPFLLSGILGYFLFLMIQKLDESPIFVNNQELMKTAEKLSFFSKKRWRKTLPIIGLSWVISSIVMTMVFLLEHLLSFSFSNYGIFLSTGTKVSLFFLIVGCVFFGFLTDRTNPAKVLVIGCFLFVMSLFALFYDLDTGGRLLVLSFSITGFFAGIIGAMPAMMARITPSQYRLSNVSLIYNSVYAIIGIFLPIILGYTTFYASYSPVVYMSLIFIITLFFSFYLYYYPKNQEEIEKFN